MKKFVTGLMIAATLATTMATGTGSAEAQHWRRPPPPYHHHQRGGGGGDAAAAAAIGIIGGMILGGALAQSSRPDYVYQDDYVVRRRPARVYYEDDYGPSRRGRPYCRTLIKYDMYGKPYEYKDCDP